MFTNSVTTLVRKQQCPSLHFLRSELITELNYNCQLIIIQSISYWNSSVQIPKLQYFEYSTSNRVGGRKFCLTSSRHCHVNFKDGGCNSSLRAKHQGQEHWYKFYYLRYKLSYSTKVESRQGTYLVPHRKWSVKFIFSDVWYDCHLSSHCLLMLCDE